MYTCSCKNLEGFCFQCLGRIRAVRVSGFLWAWILSWAYGWLFKSPWVHLNVLISYRISPSFSLSGLRQTIVCLDCNLLLQTPVGCYFASQPFTATPADFLACVLRRNRAEHLVSVLLVPPDKLEHTHTQIYEWDLSAPSRIRVLHWEHGLPLPLMEGGGKKTSKNAMFSHHL